MQSLRGEWLPTLPDRKITAVAFNIQYDQISVGLDSGEVTLVKKISGVWKVDLTLTLITWGIQRRGKFSSLALLWSTKMNLTIIVR